MGARHRPPVCEKELVLLAVDQEGGSDYPANSRIPPELLTDGSYFSNKLMMPPNFINLKKSMSLQYRV